MTGGFAVAPANGQHQNRTHAHAPGVAPTASCGRSVLWLAQGVRLDRQPCGEVAGQLTEQPLSARHGRSGRGGCKITAELGVGHEVGGFALRGGSPRGRHDAGVDASRHCRHCAIRQASRRWCGVRGAVSGKGNTAVVRR